MRHVRQSVGVAAVQLKGAVHARPASEAARLRLSTGVRSAHAGAHESAKSVFLNILLNEDFRKSQKKSRARRDEKTEPYQLATVLVPGSAVKVERNGVAMNFGRAGP